MSEAEKAKYGDIASVHNWSSIRQEPNCGKDGYIEYTCMVDHCGTTFRHTLPATGQHTWNEGVVTEGAHLHCAGRAHLHLYRLPQYPD